MLIDRVTSGQSLENGETLSFLSYFWAFFPSLLLVLFPEPHPVLLLCSDVNAQQHPCYHPMAVYYLQDRADNSVCRSSVRWWHGGDGSNKCRNFL